MSAGTPVQVRLLEKELDNLDRFRREQRNPPSRPEAIREMQIAIHAPRIR